jgi:hypothetical protein
MLTEEKKMAAQWHRRSLAAVFLAAAFSAGCNMMALPFFLLPQMDPKHDAECKLVPPDKTRNTKVMILATTGLETRPEFFKVDRELSRRVCQMLEEGFKTNKEKITVIPTSKVERYRDEHPNWHSKAPEEIGERLGADFVISLEINSMGLYETGSSNTLFRGHADISVDVIDVHKPSEGPIFRKEYRIEYPRTRPLPAGDSNVAGFREAFLKRVAQELSWLFTAHLVDDDFHMDS